MIHKIKIEGDQLRGMMQVKRYPWHLLKNPGDVLILDCPSKNTSRDMAYRWARRRGFKVSGSFQPDGMHITRLK